MAPDPQTPQTDPTRRMPKPQHMNVEADAQFLDATLPAEAPRYEEEYARTSQEIGTYGDLDQSVISPEYTNMVAIPHIEDDDGHGYRIPGEGKSRSKARGVWAFLLVGLLAAGIVAAGAYGLELWGGKHPPNVVGLSQIKATQALEAKGFAVDVETRIADDAIGVVLEQAPTSTERVDAGSHVTIVVAANREMPDVMGRALEDAQAALADSGAGEVKVDYSYSSEEEGTVIEQLPAAGEPFTSHQTITLVIAQKHVMPNVLGKTQTEAVAALEGAGFVVTVETVTSNEDEPNTVLSQDPEPDARVGEDPTATIKVAEPEQSDPLHLVDYFSRPLNSITAYLKRQGFELRSSHMDEAGHAEVSYVSEEKGTLYFKTKPYSHVFAAGDSADDLLSQGIPFVGVRWEVPASMLSGDAAILTDDETFALMSACELNNVMRACTQDTIKLPEKAEKTESAFRCTYGETSGVIWTILVANEGGDVRAVVTAAPSQIYREQIDLKPYGNAVSDFVAYTDVYTEW